MVEIGADVWDQIIAESLASLRRSVGTQEADYARGVRREVEGLQAELPAFSSLDAYDRWFDARLDAAQTFLAEAPTLSAYDEGQGRIEAVLAAHRLLASYVVAAI